MTKRRLRPRTYTYGDFLDRIEAGVRLGLRRAMKYDEAVTIPEDRVPAVVERVAREVAAEVGTILAFHD